MQAGGRLAAPTCALVYSADMAEVGDLNRACRGRYRLLYALLRSYALVPRHLALLHATPASAHDLLQFHTPDYLRALFRAANHDGDDDELAEFGLEGDCPKFAQMERYVRLVAGSTLAGVRALLERRVLIALNWIGGRHHAAPAAASGFCYVNDAVLALLALSAHFRRVAYIDLDVHHGDGVANAFAHTDAVLCVSLHYAARGFFAAAGGAITEIGRGAGRFHTVNVPLKQLATDATLDEVFASVWAMVVHAFQPQAVVLQLGVDGLAGDPLGAFQFTTAALARCLSAVRAFCVTNSAPLLVLGGGGYRAPHFARAATLLTAVAAGVRLRDSIPEHDFLHKYAPSFALSAPPPAFLTDANTRTYIDALLRRCRAILLQVRRRRLAADEDEDGDAARSRALARQQHVEAA